MNSEYLNLFHVPIQITELELDIDSLIEFCYEMKRENEKGVEKSNLGGWQSNNVINETHTEFVKLKTEIEETAKVYHEDMDFKKTVEQKIVQIWININQKGHCNDLHNHPHSTLAGVFYLTVSEASIVFQHPYQDMNNFYWDFSLIEKFNSASSGIWRIEPKPNNLLIFPPWVYHSVLSNKEDTDRISFSFNMSHLRHPTLIDSPFRPL